jgi:glucokinase
VATELAQQYPVDSIGVSAAGFISSDRQTMLATPNISNWNGVNLVAELTEILHKKIVLENDANAAAWGEFKFGAGRGRNDLMMLTLGTGVGGGAMEQALVAEPRSRSWSLIVRLRLQIWQTP